MQSNDKQFLFTHYWNADEELDILKCEADFSNDYPDTGLGKISFCVKGDEFTNEHFEKFATLERTKALEEKVTAMMKGAAGADRSED